MDTEEAGRKHFYFYKANLNQDIKDILDSKNKTLFNENQREFDPIKENEKIFYNVENNIYKYKFITIRKTYFHQEDKEDGNILTKIYQIKNIHHIVLIMFDFEKKEIITGIDTYGLLLKSDDLKNEIDTKIKFLTTENLVDNLDDLLNSKHIEKLMNLQNCLSFYLNNNDDNTDEAIFKKRKANIDLILSDLKKDKYNFNEIKEKNPNFDMKTHKQYIAGLEKSIDFDFEITNNNAEFYYFTKKSGVISNFRFKINIKSNSLVTFSDSITKEEIWDVLQRIS